MKNDIIRLLNDIRELDNKNIEDHKLPCNTYYLNDSDILCLERPDGESRFPYGNGGLVLWAYSNGRMNAQESNLGVFRTTFMCEDPGVEFWGGIKDGDKWIPISITGVTKLLYEPVEVARYTVFSRKCAYYIADTDKCIFSVRAHVTSDNAINFTASAISKVDSGEEFYVFSFIDPLLRLGNNENEWVYLLKYGTMHNNGTRVIKRTPTPDTTEILNTAVIYRNIESEVEYTVDTTLSKEAFLGGIGGSICNAVSLKNGAFSKSPNYVNTTDIPTSAEIVKFKASNNAECAVNYNIKITHDEEEAKELAEKTIDINEVEKDLCYLTEKENEKLARLDIKFGKFKDFDINNKAFNRFIKNIQKQVDHNAMNKGSGLLGSRDVYQQLTGAILFNKEEAREKIVLYLNFIFSNGRIPRCFSVPPKEDVLPQFDSREFIDQGLWMVETVYKYISFTDDLSILDEKCSYYDVVDDAKDIFKKSDRVDSVLDHLITITEYLIRNIDDRTNCLKILYGDWNDSINFMGRTTDEGKKFGTGVSVMATLQLYKLLKEMAEIFELLGKYPEKIKEYMDIREKVAQGLEKFGVQEENGERHILHGWNDKGMENVCSLKDADGKRRYSTNDNAFWTISELIKRDPTMKADILKGYDVLDSKYGVRTFYPHFDHIMEPVVGRIAKFRSGVGLNAGTYNHATMFCAMALFMMGEGKRAWEQIYKAIPITHSFLSKTSFVMPNSYFSDEEAGADGHSMGDWVTGSAPVLLRSIFEGCLGIKVVPSGIKVELPNYMPSDEIKMSTEIKNCKVDYIYKNKNSGKRKYFVNGVEQEGTYDSVLDNKVIFIANEDIGKELKIEIVD